MGTGCTKEPKVIETNKNRRQIIDLKNKIKLKTIEVENKIRDKKKEVEKYKQQAKLKLKSGDKLEAKRLLQKKIFNEKIVERLYTQVKILDDQVMILENTEINKDIAETIQSVNEKIKEVTGNIDVRELEKAVDQMNENREKQREMQEDFNQAIEEANEGDPDISEELEKMEAAMDNYPKANTEKLVNDNEPAHKEPAGNLVFL